MEKADILKMVIVTYFREDSEIPASSCFLQLSCPNAAMHAGKENVTSLGSHDGLVQGDLPWAQAAEE